MTTRQLPGEDVVRAAAAGDRRAVDILVAGYLPLIYNVVGRAMPGDADVDDVVQETMVRLITHLDQLREPGRMRSWAIAVTVHQIRDRYRARTRRMTAPDEIPMDLADPGADFVDLTIVRLGLSQQRREVAEATRWLDADDRELLALWWLEAAGQISRSDVIGALGTPAADVSVRIHRMRAQLETARGIVRALHAEGRCRDLDALLSDWDGRPASLWRKRLARHTRECVLCGELLAPLVEPELLLAGLPLVLPPTRLHAAVHLGTATHVAGSGGHAAPGPAHTPSVTGLRGHAAGYEGPRQAGHNATLSGRRGRAGGARRPTLIKSTAVAAVALAVVVIVVVTQFTGRGPAAAAPGMAAPVGTLHPGHGSSTPSPSRSAVRSAAPSVSTPSASTPSPSPHSTSAAGTPPFTDTVPTIGGVAARELGPIQQNGRIAGRDNGQSTGYGNESIWIFDDTTLGNPWGFLSNTGAATTDLNAANGISLTSTDPFHTSGGPGWADLLPRTPAEIAFQQAHAAKSCTGSSDPYCGAIFGFWPGAVIADPARHRVLVFYGKLCRGGRPGTPCSGALGKGLGTGIAALDMRTHTVIRLTATGRAPVTSVEGVDPTMLFPASVGYGGDALVVGTTAYVYGQCSYTCKLARAPLASITDAAQWSYFTGRSASGAVTWSSSRTNAVGTIAPGAAGGTVLWSAALHSWLNFFMPYGSNTLMYQSGGSPYGPWSSGHSILATATDSTHTNYAAYAHPEYATGNGLVQYVSYFQPSTGAQRLVQVTFAR